MAMASSSGSITFMFATLRLGALLRGSSGTLTHQTTTTKLLSARLRNAWPRSLVSALSCMRFHSNAAGRLRIMRRWLFIFTLIGIVLPPAVAVAQKSATPAPGPMALQVRSEFLSAWNAYKQYAWGHDELTA